MLFSVKANIFRKDGLICKLLWQKGKNISTYFSSSNTFTTDNKYYWRKTKKENKLESFEIKKKERSLDTLLFSFYIYGLTNVERTDSVAEEVDATRGLNGERVIGNPLIRYI